MVHGVRGTKISFDDETKLYTDENGNEYYVKHNGGEFEVAKFKSGDTVPSDVYRVYDGKHGFRCNCPGFDRGVTSKHIDLVKDWLDRGKPIPTAFSSVDFRVEML